MNPLSRTRHLRRISIGCLFFLITLSINAFFCLRKIESWQHFIDGEQSTGTIAQVLPPPAGSRGGKLMVSYQTRDGTTITAGTGYSHGYRVGEHALVTYRKDRKHEFVLGDVSTQRNKELWLYGIVFALHLLVAGWWLFFTR